ncbi:jouberin-like isoform X2 [Paramacrobiotus metropolitanus]|uniref:jouberin-like isoform X2 n=1 Tax=Paramacrobiotus metropolitanus TaxID=2943436 RepID=UPI002446160F|nr:jouberin-like isoform X2 [Paramacrobiotus metropolitanus]
MDRPDESFAKAATKHWFRDLLGGKNNSARSSIPNTARTVTEQYDLTERIPSNKRRTRSAGHLEFSRPMTFAAVDHPAGLADEKDGSYSAQVATESCESNYGSETGGRNAVSTPESSQGRHDSLRIENEISENYAEENTSTSPRKNFEHSLTNHGDPKESVTDNSLIERSAASHQSSHEITRSDSSLALPLKPFPNNNDSYINDEDVRTNSAEKKDETLKLPSPGSTDSDEYLVVVSKDLIPIKKYRRRRKLESPGGDHTKETVNLPPKMIVSEVKLPKAELKHTEQEQKAEPSAKIETEDFSRTINVSEEDMIVAEESNEELEVQEEERILTASKDRLRKVFALIVHRTDRLAVSSLVQSVVVRISIIDRSTSDYLKKTKRAATFYYENARKDLDYILPVMTRICDIPKSSNPVTSIPAWEEQLLYNEEFARFASEDVLLFFELADFIPAAKATNPSKSHKWEDASFKPVAWGFYKMQSLSKKVTTGRKRLQLYLPISTGLLSKRSATFPTIYRWYLTKIRIRYPSTLYVTLVETEISNKVPPVLRSVLPNQPEIAKVSYTRLKSMLGSQINLEGSSASETTVETHPKNDNENDVKLTSEPTKRKQRASVRLPHQKCLIPNNVHMEIAVGQEGATATKFSISGRNIAFACFERQAVAFVQINDVRSSIVRGRLYGSCGIIYELDWNRADSRILAASADGTAKIWNSETCHPNFLISLPHPGFVYSAQFHPVQQHIVATGCFDGVIRVWNVSTSWNDFLLIAELSSHSGFINCLLFNELGNELFSAGSDGYIKVWKQGESALKVNENLANWSPSHELLIPINVNTASGITDLKWIPNRGVLLALTQDEEFHYIDTKRLIVIGSVVIGAPVKYRLRGAVTPCGSHLYVPTNESTISVFNLSDGKQERQITNAVPSAVLDVDFHPSEHMLAYCGLGYRRKAVIMNHYKEFTDTPTLTLKRKTEKKREILPVIKLAKGMSLIDSGRAYSQSEKISVVLEKLNEITNDLKARESLSMENPNRLSTAEGRIAAAAEHNRNGSWISQMTHTGTHHQHTHRGFMLNLSKL